MSKNNDAMPMGKAEEGLLVWPYSTRDENVKEASKKMETKGLREEILQGY